MNETTANSSLNVEAHVLNVQDEADNKVKGRRLARTAQWKKYFFKAYREKNYSLASYIYFTKHPYRADTMNVHECYKLERKTDREIFIAILTLAAVVAGVIAVVYLDL
jgi:hypothetical protein